jgi:hypothetical protein
MQSYHFERRSEYKHKDYVITKDSTGILGENQVGISHQFILMDWIQ